MLAVQAQKVQVHASQISDYSTCPRMYYFKYVLGLVPKAENSKLFFGKGMHRGLEVYYKTGDADAAEAAYAAWLTEKTEALRAANADMEVVKESADIGASLLAEYINYARQNDNFIAEFVEQEFVVPIWSPDGNETGMEHAGTWDGIVRDRYGKLWLMEHKTAKNFPSELDLKLNRQNRYYLLAAHQVFDEGVRGTVYNVIRKVNPKRTKTPVIFRRFIPSTPVELISTRDQMYRAAERMLSDEYYDPNPGMHCNWKCSYDQLCCCMQEGVDFTPIVDGLYDKN